MDNFWKVLILIAAIALGVAGTLVLTQKSPLSSTSTPERVAFTEPTSELTADQLEDKRNLSSMVEIVKENIAPKLFGGFNELKLKVKNHSKYNIDIVSIEVKVYKSNGDLYSDEIFHTGEIEAFGEVIVDVPSKNRGTEYRTRIIQLRCDELKYDYDEIPR